MSCLIAQIRSSGLEWGRRALAPYSRLSEDPDFGGRRRTFRSLMHGTVTSWPLVSLRAPRPVSPVLQLDTIACVSAESPKASYAGALAVARLCPTMPPEVGNASNVPNVDARTCHS
jgi:hypothetical protein